MGGLLLYESFVWSLTGTLEVEKNYFKELMVHEEGAALL